MLIDKLREYKKILIVGYGVEGKSTEKFLQKYHPSAHVTIVDQRDGKDYLENQQLYDLAIKTPSISAKNLTIPFTTQTNIFFANTFQKKIGITGSKGKSTTASLVHHILLKAGMSSKLLGNIGVPMLDYFLGEMNDDDIFVLELSSYQLGDIHYSPNIACFINIYNDHVAQHGSRWEYFAAKAHIVTHSSEKDFFIYNGTFPEIAQLAKSTKAHGIDFSAVPKDYIPSHPQLSNDSIRAAHEVARLLNISEAVFTSSVQSFSGLAHRLQRVGEYNGITFINDSSATTPEAATFAILQTPKVDTIILGGLDRQLDVHELIRTVSQKNINHFILFPDTQEKLMQLLLRAGVSKKSIHNAQNMNEAVVLCFQHSRSGDVCLLSPGFASYNQYENFPARGDDFTKLVQLLGSK